MNTAINTLYPFIKKGAKISIDSRKIDNETLFFALKGSQADGNDFALQAIENGALLAVVDNPDIIGERIVNTTDTLSTLQELARYHRRQLNIPVLGITGSNGKTTTKELISSVLSQKFKTLSTQGNYNNHIGVPLTILSIQNWHEIAVIEMGANHMGEIDFLSNMAMPDAGIITNVGKAHIEGFGSEHNVVIAKTELYRFLEKSEGIVFINNDNSKLTSHCNCKHKITYGFSASNVTGRILPSDPFLKIAFEAAEVPQSVEIQTKLIGDYNFENILAAATIGLYYGITPLQIKTAIESYIPKNNRSQLKETNSNKVIMDAYNANPSSMSVAIKNFASRKDTNKGYILGDMLELGSISDYEHKYIIEMLEQLPFSFALLIGQEFGKIPVTNPKILQFANSLEAAMWLQKNPVKHHSVLIKGSRGIQLELLEKHL